MTKFTKERLEEITELARKATYKPCAMHMTNLLVVCDSEVIEEMARQLLASMEQEAVAWLLSGGGAKNDVRFDNSNAYADPLREVTPLYAAPQLPQSAVVPDALDDYVNSDEHPLLWSHNKGWNACRAAMLQGAENTESRCTIQTAPALDSSPKIAESRCSRR